MTKKYKFTFYIGAGSMNDSSEIVELSEHLDENEIELEFMEWLFNQLDMAGVEGGWEEVE